MIFLYPTTCGRLSQLDSPFNFYEHVLRKEEDTLSVAYYILNNPVRKGLAYDYRRYKFLGSFEFEIM
jgi:hypothetical protein